MIGPAKSRLEQCIEESENLLKTKVTAESDFDGEEGEAEYFINRLSTNSLLLERCNKDRSNILKDAKGEVKATEEREYARATEGENSFIELILTANDTIARLKGRITLISRKREGVDHLKAVTSAQHELQPIIEHATHEITRVANQSTLTLTSTSVSQQLPGDSVPVSVNLRKLHLPTFDGSVLKWPEFWDIFDTSVHRQNIPKVSKFSYLKGALCGSASVAISGISVTEDNYDTVVALLKEKFGGRESIIEMLYAKLHHLPTSSGKFNDIKYTYNSVERLLRQLESQGEAINVQKMLIYQILSKFPLEVVLKLEDAKKCEVEWTMQLLRKLLNQHITIQESAQRRVANAKGRVHTNDSRQAKQDDVRNTYPSSAELNKGDRRMYNETPVDTFATNVRRGNGKNMCCVFCKGDHYNDECEKFKLLSERKQRLITQGRCFVCFKVGHTFRDCPSTQRQSCHYCEKRGHHNRAICPQKFGNQLEGTSKDADSDNVNPVIDDSSNQPSEVVNSTSIGSDQILIASGEKVLLQTANVPIQMVDGTIIMARVLLDSASHRTFMTEKLAKELKLQTKCKEMLSVSTFGAKNPYDVDTYVVNFNVMTKDNLPLPLHANVVNKITGPIQRGPLQSADLEFLVSISSERMADTVPKTSEPVNIDLLIGSDYFWNILGTEKVTLPSSLYLVSSKIGYILTGRYSDPGHMGCHQNVSTCFVMTQVNHTVSKVSLFSSSDSSITKSPGIEDFWKLETIGITDLPDLTDDDVALEQFNNSICFENGRYYVRWPWRYDCLDLPENLDVAIGRLKSLAKHFQRDKDLLVKYDDVITSQIKQGIIEKVVVDTKVERKHYLPHHPVVIPSKSTTMLRIVYDASTKAKKGDKSLNECLYRGSVLLPDLCGALLGFRVQSIVLLVDIEKAFLQVAIQESDRDVTRFLWFRDLTNLHVAERTLDVYRFCRVPFGIICSPFLLAGTIKYHLRQIYTSVASKISDNIYVDNVMLGANSVQDAYEMYLESKDIFKRASMNLREWISNSLEFLKLLPESETVKGNIVKTFGIPWNYTEDYLQIGGINYIHVEDPPTKEKC